MEVSAEKVISHILEQNKQLTLEIAVLRAQLEEVEAETQEKSTEKSE